ncbi:hypothetical protein AB8A31_09055 [Tardiphaga sp. 804_B3_N1_9]|uniref:hypothetical protein n=1 Tax=Tardiphaga sp. 804_B3_N1_9 TaxID=3240786 RepID=UPI003F234F9E
MSEASKKVVLGLAATLLLADILAPDQSAAAQKVRLFKVITVKDDIVIGLNDEQMSHLQAKDAAGVARALVDKRLISAWQYRVRTGKTGIHEQLPYQPIALLALQTIRVEPYVTPLKVYPLPLQANWTGDD